MLLILLGDTADGVEACRPRIASFLMVRVAACRIMSLYEPRLANGSFGPYCANMRFACAAIYVKRPSERKSRFRDPRERLFWVQRLLNHQLINTLSGRKKGECDASPGVKGLGLLS